MPKESCLHCLLLKTLESWLKSHHASEDQIITMIGQFTADSLARSCQEEVTQILIYGRKFNESKSLH